MLTVRERIQAARRRRGMSQRDLGAALPDPVSHPVISYIERGQQRLTLDLVCDLARTLDVPVSWLLAPILEDGDVGD
jgi:transcriptional regulator with XRE-family HTH domain